MQNEHTRVLVTGGAGFIGFHLVESLVRMGKLVSVIDCKPIGTESINNSILPQIEIINNDLGTLLHQNRIDFSHYSWIFHLAGTPLVPLSIDNPEGDYISNLRNSFLLLEALRKTPNPPKLVNISSAAVYGNPLKFPIRETDPTVPISPYGVSKLAVERYASVYSQLYGLPVCSLRLFSVYGPRQHKLVIYELVKKLMANPREIHLLGDGSQGRDFVYIVDVINALLLAAINAPAKGEVYNVASGSTVTIDELVNKLCSVMSLTPNIVYSGKARPGDPDRWVVDISNLSKLGFTPEVPLEMGLRSVYTWAQSELFQANLQSNSRDSVL